MTDGAEWEQGFIDFHRPDAVRILDFAHAAEHLSAVGEAIWGQGTPATAQWFEQQLAVLKQQGPGPMLAELHALQQTHPSLDVLTGTLADPEKRQKQIQYPDYLAQGLPIGSGAIESGNKLVVEARLKGAGMHWARSHVNPMLALRNIACNDRWTEAWPAIVAHRTIKPPNANASDVNSAPRFLIPYLPSPPSILRQFLLLPLPSPCLQHRLAHHPALQLPNLLPYPTVPQPTIPGAARPSEKPSISHLPKLPRKTNAHPGKKTVLLFEHRHAIMCCN